MLPATVFFLTWYFGFIILAGVAPDFMGEKVIEGVTIGYIFALSQFVMVWVLAAAYLRRADKVFDPLAKRQPSARSRARRLRRRPALRRTGDGQWACHRRQR